MAYYSTHGISKFLLNNENQRVRFLLARPVYTSVYYTTVVYSITILHCVPNKHVTTFSMIR